EATARNLSTRPFQTYDGAGVATSARFDFQGNLIEASQRLATEYRETADWSPLSELDDLAEIELAASARLEQETFTTTPAYAALHRVVSRITPDASETRPTYDAASLLKRVQVRLRGAPAWTRYVDAIDYNARGQRTRASYGNGTEAAYAYDDETFRLTRLV